MGPGFGACGELSFGELCTRAALLRTHPLWWSSLLPNSCFSQSVFMVYMSPRNTFTKATKVLLACGWNPVQRGKSPSSVFLVMFWTKTYSENLGRPQNLPLYEEVLKVLSTKLSCDFVCLRFTSLLPFSFVELLYSLTRWYVWKSLARVPPIWH